MEKEKMINAVELKAGFPRSLCKIVCLYADSSDQHSLRVIRSYGVRGFRPLQAYRFREDPRYCLITCELRKEDKPDFMAALLELHRDLLVMGYRDYEEYCEWSFRRLEEALKAS